jgi:hypothetical protein
MVYVFINGPFNDTVSSSDHAALSDRMFSE